MNTAKELATEQAPEMSIQEDNQTTQNEKQTQEQSQEKELVKKEPPAKKLDMSSPITVTPETIVMVKGRKCALRLNPSTNQLVAFPIRPPNSTGKKQKCRKLCSVYSNFTHC